MTAPGSGVRLERRGASAWAILDRPGRLNALDPAIIAGLHAWLDESEADEAARCLVLTGSGRAFCAGADLGFVHAMPRERREEATLDFLREAGALMTRLEAFPKPVIAAVNGVAVAGGLELVLCCDLVVAVEGARLGDGHANYGLLPGAGGSARLPRRLGLARAKQLLFTGELWPASALAAMGLVNLVVPDGELDAAAERLVGTIAAKSPLGLGWMKALANAAPDGPLEDALAREFAANAAYAGSRDREEGLAAFAEGRRPVFEGR